MYVEDMTLADARATLRELQALRSTTPQSLSEQLDWDIEDVEGRIFTLTA